MSKLTAGTQVNVTHRNATTVAHTGRVLFVDGVTVAVETPTGYVVLADVVDVRPL